MAGTTGRSWKRRTKQCVVCRKHFLPHPRVGERQRTCGDAECRREVHQQSRMAWRAANRGHDRAERLRERLREEHQEHQAVPAGPAGARPRPQVDGAVVREVVGADLAVVIDEALQVTTNWLRESVRTDLAEIKLEFLQVRAQVPREAMSSRAPPP